MAIKWGTAPNQQYTRNFALAMGAAKAGANGGISALQMRPSYIDRAAEVEKARGMTKSVIAGQNQGARARAAEMGLDYVPDQSNIIGQAGLLASAANKAGMTAERENVGIYNAAQQFNAQQALRDKALNIQAMGSGGGITRGGGRTQAERNAGRDSNYGGGSGSGGSGGRAPLSRGIDSLLQREQFKYDTGARGMSSDEAMANAFTSGRGSTVDAAKRTKAERTNFLAGKDRAIAAASKTYAPGSGWTKPGERGYSAGVTTGGAAKEAIRDRRGRAAIAEMKRAGTDPFDDMWGV